MRTLAIFLFLTGALFADSTQPKRYDFLEGGEKYYALAVVNGTYLSGFRIFDSKDHFIQLVDWVGVYLSTKVPDYILTAFQLDDYNFDGYPDIILPGDGSSEHMEYVEVWLWVPKLKKFVSNQDLDDAEITRIDPQKKYLYSSGRAYAGCYFTSTYKYSSSGKLVKLSEDTIDYGKNSEVKTFYADGKVTKTVTSVPPPQ